MTQSKRLSIVLLLNVSMIAGLVLVGLSSNSIGVLAAAGDYIADSAAIVLGLIAIRIRDDGHHHRHVTTIVAAINASALLLITAFVMLESVHRLAAGAPHILGLQAMVISIISAISMVIGAIILVKGKNDNDLHMRSVLLDTVSDAASAAAVAVTGAVIFLAHGLYWLDSAVALAIGLLIGFNALKLIRDVSKSLSTQG